MLIVTSAEGAHVAPMMLIIVVVGRRRWDRAAGRNVSEPVNVQTGERSDRSIAAAGTTGGGPDQFAGPRSSAAPMILSSTAPITPLAEPSELRDNARAIVSTAQPC